MSEVNLPQVGAYFTFEGQSVRITEIRKRGRGYQVAYTAVPGERSGGNVRLADWNKRATQTGFAAVAA